MCLTGARGVQVRRTAAGVLGIVALMAALMSGVAVAQESEFDGVPIPGSGTNSDWDGIVPQAGGAGVGGPSVSGPVVDLPGNPRRLHVKFFETAGVVWNGSSLDDGPGTSALDSSLSAAIGLHVEPLFKRPVAALEADRTEAENRSGQPQPDLSSWFLMTMPSPAGGNALLAGLEALSVVEIVQAEPALTSTAPLEEERQEYLDPAASGVDAEWAWGRPGGTGNNVTIAVVDSGFDTSHPDLDKASAIGVSVPNEAPWDPHHGLQVLGILVADDDDFGIRGIAHGSGVRTVTSGRTSGELANAIDLAAAVVGPGDVISISQGICAVSGCANGVVLPLIYSTAAAQALRTAAARGVITVVSGGNGGANLANYESRLVVDSPSTIVVGAANPPATSNCGAGAEPPVDGPARSRIAVSNYGTRVDLQGWGACVRTASQGGGYKWWGATSAATPVVAGAAALLSSLAQQSIGLDLAGSQVRALFQATGSPQVTGSRGGHIGPLPDVRAAFGALDLIPAHDMWVSASPVDDVPSAAIVDVRFAGVEIDEPALTCGSISNTVWYSITPSTDVDITIDTNGSDFDTMLGLWRRSGDRLVPVDCHDDITINNVRSQLTSVLLKSQTYYIQAGGDDGAAGRLKLNVTSTNFVSSGCDINGDFYGDLVSGSPGESIGNASAAGRALIHYGRPDGRPTRVTSVTQEWPGVSGDSEKGDRFGATVACGDFNGDGYDDVAIGSPGEGIGSRRKAGAVRVIPGSASGLDTSGATTLTQDSPGVAGGVEVGDRFGAALATGDFNGDGYGDLAIGVTREDIGAIKNAGAVHVLYGSRSGLRTAGSKLFHGNNAGLPNSAEAGDRFGTQLASGDFDFDGFDELVVGVPFEDLVGRRNAGAVLVLPGSSTGTTTEGSIILHQNFAGVAGTADAFDRFGRALAVGNVNGDQYADLVVGVPGEDIGDQANAGTVVLFFGSSGGLRSTDSKELHQDAPGVKDSAEERDRFGAALAVGDIDRDGFGDVVVGVPGERVGGFAGAGAVHILDGSASGPTGSGDQLLHQNRPGIGGRAESGDHFGASVTTLDLNADGRRDLVVGVPDEDMQNRANVGLILIVPGGAGGARRAESSGLGQRSPRIGVLEANDRFGATFARA